MNPTMHSSFIKTVTFQKDFEEVSTTNSMNQSSVNASWIYTPPFSYEEAAVVAGLLLPMAVFGVFSNILNILVINQSEKLSLSVSDLLSAFISILMLYRASWGFLKWNIPVFLCKVYWGGDLITSIGTSLHIFVFCGLRFVAIAKPLASQKIQMVHAKISIVIIWVISTITGVFTHGWWAGTIEIDRRKNTVERDWPVCSFDVKWLPQFSEFGLYGYTVFFYIPFLGIIILTSSIVVVLLKQRSKRIIERRNQKSVNEAELIRQKKENQAVCQLVLIVVSFLMGYIPLSLFYILLADIEGGKEKWLFGTYAYVCMRFSESLNPIFYNLGSSKLRAETVLFLKKIFRFKTNIETSQSA